jgi:hypothetical protein
MVLVVSGSIIRIAIWNRNVKVSLIVFVVFSGSVALDIRRMFRVPCCLYQYLMFPLHSRSIGNGELYIRSHLDSMS